MTILITGITGLLAPYLAAEATKHDTVRTTARSGGDFLCNLSDLKAVQSLINRVQPKAVIHAAGLTNVDTCETEPQAADQANHIGAVNLVTALTPGQKLVYISTDQVYPDTVGPHKEGTERPINHYGSSKWDGEKASLRHKETLVLRTNLFGPSITKGRTSLSDWVKERLQGSESVTFFEDVWFSPLHLESLASLVLHSLQKDLKGVFNVGSRNGQNKDQFCRAVAKQYGLSTKTATTGRSSNFPMRAPRALDLRMDVTKIEAALGLTMPTLSEEIAKL